MEEAAARKFTDKNRLSHYFIGSIKTENGLMSPNIPTRNRKLKI